MISGAPIHEAMLAFYLERIMQFDTDEEFNYEYRNHVTWLALAEAAQLGYRIGFAIDTKEPDWPVAYIDLPNGQVSWHMPKYPAVWDGHTTTEKYARIRQYINWSRKKGWE
jgi:hypothetical protein